MARTTNTNVLAAIADEAQMTFELLEIDWPVDSVVNPTGENVYLTNAPFNVRALGQEWLSLGDFLSFDGIDEVSDLTINTVNITLSGARTQFIQSDQTLLDIWFSQSYIDQPIRIYRAFFDSQHSLIGYPILIFDGRMDKPTISDDPGQGTTIGISCSSIWADFDTVSGRSTNHDQQRSLFPGDTGFAYAHQVTKDLKWGNG